MSLECDYLVIGAGAAGMAFVDEVLQQDKNATFIVVERQFRPSGHWNVSYPFVHLHQPQAFYGVNSKVLGDGGDALASQLEITAYYDAVMKDMKKTGRVDFRFLCEYKGNQEFSPVRSPEKVFSVNVRRKTVNAAYLEVQVPATVPPKYDFDADVKPQPPNVLSANIDNYDNFVIIGAGKTAIDSILYLIDNHVDANRIIWIKSSESWLYDRDQCQTLTFCSTIGAQMGASLKAKSMDEFWDILEQSASVHKIYDDMTPTKFRCATVSPEELVKCRSVTNVVRMGRVRKIHSQEIELEQGVYPTSSRNLHVDCTASGLTNSPKGQCFTEGHLALQSVFTCQQIFSAALLAYIEVNYETDEKRNEVAGNACWFPEESTDILRMTLDTSANLIRWEKEPALSKWMSESRLYAFSYVSEQEYNSRLASNLNLLKMPGVTKQLRKLWEANYAGEAFPLDAVYALNKSQTVSVQSAGKGLAKTKQFSVDKEDFTQSQVTEVEVPALEEGEVQLKILKFGFTANNVSYAVGGDLLSFWDYYPASDDSYGVIPAWGIGEVVESNVGGIATGERIWGFLPMAETVNLKVGNVTDGKFMETGDHRVDMPALYNTYIRLNQVAGMTEVTEDWISIIRWLSMTSFLIWEQVESSRLGEEQIVIDTASSKTAIGNAFAFKNQGGRARKLVGLTSAGNLEFVQSLGLYDQVLTYDQVDQIETGIPTINLNFSGNYDIIRDVHRQLEHDLVLSLNIGLAHWREVDSAADMLSPQAGVVGPMPMPFLMFNRIVEMEEKWGEEKLFGDFEDYLAPFLNFVDEHMTLLSGTGESKIKSLYEDVLNKKVAPKEGVLMSFVEA